MELKVSDNINELSTKAADWITEYINEVLQQRERFTIALSGGSTPKNLYRLLASEPYISRIDWSKIHCFWGDERYVPFDDDKNNAKMAFENLLNHVPVLPEHIHIMRTDIEPDAPARTYEKILHNYFDNTENSFDLVLLGLGDDAHTLSLFPGQPIIHEKKKWVDSFYLAKQNMHRITMTAPIVNKSARIVFLVTGADKAEPLYRILYGQHEPELYPAQLIQPYNGKTYWFVDRAAAAELQL